MEGTVLREIILVLAASVLVLLISYRLKLPAIVGFLVTGILLGPGGLRIVGDTEEIGLLAEIGVVMLLFTVGLEFSLDALRRLRRTLWLGGGAQVLATILIVMAGMLALGYPPAIAALFGLLMTHTSTTVLLKTAGDRGELDAPHVRVALGINLFQDLAFVPMAALVPVLASAGTVSTGRLGLRLGLGLCLLIVVFLVARYIMPGILFRIVQTKLRELFILASLFVCLGMALLSSALGLSPALGAFLAGIVVSESAYSLQVVSDILPFKHVFSSLFFVSIGMLLDLGSAWAARSAILFLVPAALAVKLVTGFGAVRILRFPPRVAFLAGVSMIPLGEFSFALAGIGRTAGLLPEDAFQAFMATSVLTILVTPLLLERAGRWADALGRLFRWEGAVSPAAARAAESHVVIAGYGLNGRNLAKVLKAAGVGYAILELDPEIVRSAAADGEPVIFGDATSRVLLKEAGVDRAKVVVFAISDPKAMRRGVEAAREMNPRLHIIVRTRYAVDVERLYEVGADDVIPEEFETSIEIFSRVLSRFHVPRNVIDAQVRIVRDECYGILRGSCAAVRPSADRVADLLTAGTAETFYVGRGAWPAGRTLGEIDVRRRTGATVIAVVRNEESFASPGAGFEVREQDTLVLVANHRDIDRAFRYLTIGDEEPPPTSTSTS
jgi:monovalent cation:H+ antiporter-2, CPA2 family